MDQPSLKIPKGKPWPLPIEKIGQWARSPEEMRLERAWRLENESEYVNACKRYVVEELEALGVPASQGRPVSERIVRNLISNSVTRSLLEYGDHDSLRADEFPGFEDFFKSAFGVAFVDPRPYYRKEQV